MTVIALRAASYACRLFCFTPPSEVFRVTRPDLSRSFAYLHGAQLRDSQGSSPSYPRMIEKASA